GPWTGWFGSWVWRRSAMNDIPTTSWRAQSGGAPADPARRLWESWRQGQQPDVRDFLVPLADELSPTQVAAVLRVDQRERWQGGERIQDEAYLRDFPVLQADEEAALDVIYGEFLLREERGESPTLEEYVRRFPQYEARLCEPTGFHQAMQDTAGYAVPPPG